jgi:hypothetical protein
MLRVAWIAIVVAACDVGDVTGGLGSGMGTPDAGSAAAVDAAPINGPSLRVTFTTSQTPAPQYAPNNIVAIWVVDSNAMIKKTIGRWADVRKQYLLAWNQSAGTSDVDAISGATRTSHGSLSVTWDLKDRQDALIGDGTYTVRLESTDLNATATTQNNQATFTFVKGAAPESQTGLSGGGFTNVSIEFMP